MIKIPGEIGWKQSNQGDTLGSIVESFNIDLESNRGRIRTTRSKLITSGDGATGNFGPVSAIVYLSNALRVFAGTIAGDNLWEGGNSPFDTLTNDTTSTNVAIDDGDAVVFNNLIYATSSSDITRYDGSTETSVSSGLTDNTHHLLEVFTPDGSGERLYVTEGNDKVWSVSQANSLASSSTYTLDLSLEPFYQITGLSAGTDRLWIAVSCAGNNNAAGDSYVFTWDGVTANAPTAKYRINSSRIMAMVVKDDLPYIVDSRGRLMGWNGGVFKELDKLPVRGDKLLLNTSTNLHQNALHPRGMAIDEDEILICVSNLAEGSTGSTTFYHDFPSGVWAYNERNGLYHKYSPSTQAVADTGVSNLTDYGQFRAAYAGVIHVQDINTYVATDGGRVMFGMGYFASASDNLSSNITYGIFTDDTPDTTQKGGWIVTPRIDAEAFIDNYENFYPAFSRLITSGDTVNCKYRFEETSLITTATWTSTTDFVSADELTDFEDGDEVTVIQGKGSGACINTSRIESGSGSHAYLENAVTGVTGTSKVRVEKWRKVCNITDYPTRGYLIGKKAQWIQFKIYMQWTGAREFYNLLVTNKSILST